MRRSLTRCSPATVLAVLLVAFAVGCSDGTNNAVNRPNDTTDTQPPLSPAIDGWTAKDGGPVRLTWTANGEADFAGYNLYRYAPHPDRLQSYSRINPGLITTNSFVVTDAQPGVYEYYRVSAVDADGNESALSSAVETSFHYPSDNQPPPIEPNTWP